MAEPSGRARAVLWDADGVLQRMPVREQVFPTLAPDASAALAAAVFGPLPELLTGRLDMAAHLDAVLAEHGLAGRRADVLELWGGHPPVREARDLLAAVRRSGVRCVLATNQDTLMAARMREPFAELLDAVYFSCDVGAAKPEPAYFAHVAEREGLPPDRLLLLDDSAVNVAGAREAGLAAEQWHADDGVEALRAALERHGLWPIDR